MFHQFTAFALKEELDLTKVGSQLGVTKKYRWEEPMQLNPSTFKPVSDEILEEQYVYLHSFGGIVFLNCSDAVINNFGKEMGKISNSFRCLYNIKFQEAYSLRINPGNEPEVGSDYAVVPHYDKLFFDIIAFVVAKSVALERIEEQVDSMFDEVEGLIALLELGNLSISDKKLALLASKILNFKYRSISHIMVLDKPEITWDNTEADRFYRTMANQFELNQRYQDIKHKAETLMDITEVFSGLSHARRSERLELIVIALIFIEIVIYVFQCMH